MMLSSSLPADAPWGLFLLVTHSFLPTDRGEKGMRDKQNQTPRDVCGEASYQGHRRDKRDNYEIECRKIENFQRLRDKPELRIALITCNKPFYVQKKKCKIQSKFLIKAVIPDPIYLATTLMHHKLSPRVKWH